MTATFDRTGYQKQILGSEASRGEKSVLVYLATYCEPDRTISVSTHTAKKIAPQLSMTNNTVGRTIQNLKDIGLLTEVEKTVEVKFERGMPQKRRRKFYQLPTEEKLALYTPKK